MLNFDLSAPWVYWMPAAFDDNGPTSVPKNIIKPNVLIADFMFVLSIRQAFELKDKGVSVAVVVAGVDPRHPPIRGGGVRAVSELDPVFGAVVPLRPRL